MKKVLPLSGIRILDLSQVLAGPYSAMLLAGLGADVIKVEAPEGDLSRSMGPPYVDGTGTLYLAANRNKKSLVLDLKRPEGRSVLHRLVKRSDVLIHNFRPRAARRLRADCPTLSRINPRLVYASVAAFGHSGPYVERPGLDGVLQAMGGLMSLTGDIRGDPVKTAAPIVDVGTGFLLALGVVASLLERHKTGKGKRVSATLFDTALAFQTSLFTYGSAIGRDPERVGNGAYYTITDCFRTSDGSVLITLPTSRFWTRLRRALGEDPILKDPMFATHGSRILHKDKLSGALQRIFVRRPTADWLQILGREEVPCGPVLTFSQVLQEPQVVYNRMFRQERFGRAAKYTVVRSPVRLNMRLMDGNLPAPRLGQHTREILRCVGYSPDQIEKLESLGITRPQPVDIHGA